MVRALLTATAALAVLGAAKPPIVDYRLSVEPVTGRPPLLSVDIRLRGDADGVTELLVPAGLAGEALASGAAMDSPDPTHRLLRHKPGAKLKLRYQLYATAEPDGLAMLGESVFALPEGRPMEAARFRLGHLPAGWRAATDLNSAATVEQVRRSVILAGPRLQVAERTIAGGMLRVAVLGGEPGRAEKLVEAAAPVVIAQRAFWGDGGPFLVASGPFTAPADRDDAVALPPVAAGELRDSIAAAYVRGWIPGRTGHVVRAAPWFTEDFAGVVADRALLRAGLITSDSAVGRLAAADEAKRRGVALALKWDEEIRRKTAGKADLDDVILRMRDHYRQFPSGQGPDVVTGLVSAAWVVAQLDLRPDIARYVDGGAAVPLPERMFDGCLEARVTVAPGFDSGFDHGASAAAKIVKGVRVRGPAWNSGLRNGMRIDAIDLKQGDPTREIALTVRPPRGNGKARSIRYWPYGDNDVETRRLRFANGLSDTALVACGRKIAGL